MTLEEINRNLSVIRQVVDENVDISVPVMVLEKLNKLSNLLGLSAECVAHAGMQYNIKIGEIVRSGKYNSYGATDKKLIIASDARTEIYVMEYAEKLNKEIHYAVEAGRTMLSYLKEEMKNAQSQEG